MTPRDRYPADDPREWLGQAHSSLTHAQSTTPGVDLENLCFDAQQAAEKSIKAVLIASGVEFPFTHDLAKLVTLLEVHGEHIPPEIRRAEDLTPFAVFTRYPGSDPIPRPIYEDAVAIAEAVVVWAAERINENHANSN
jgi:HEPN domain-containing protein